MIFFLIMLGLVSILGGCGSSLESLLLSNISEVQEHVFVGASKGIVATFVVGNREEDYIKNGISTKSVPFAVLTIASEEKTAITVDNFNLLIGKCEYSGHMLKNPYTGEYQVDLDDVRDGGDVVLLATICGVQVDIALLSISDDLNFNFNDAIGVVADSRSEKINGVLKNGKFNGEVYIKLLGELKRNNKDLSWGITIISTDGKRINFVVSADTGAVLLCS